MNGSADAAWLADIKAALARGAGETWRAAFHRYAGWNHVHATSMGGGRDSSDAYQRRHMKALYQLLRS